jgi:hypothetical protein
VGQEIEYYKLPKAALLGCFSQIVDLFGATLELDTRKSICSLNRTGFLI